MVSKFGSQMESVIRSVVGALRLKSFRSVVVQEAIWLKQFLEELNIGNDEHKLVTSIVITKK